MQCCCRDICHVIAMLLQWYCHDIAMLLTFYDTDFAMLWQCYKCNEIAMLLTWFCNAIARWMQCHCNAIAAWIQRDRNVIAIRLQWHCCVFLLFFSSVFLLLILTMSDSLTRRHLSSTVNRSRLAAAIRPIDRHSTASHGILGLKTHTPELSKKRHRINWLLHFLLQLYRFIYELSFF